jgi:predicted P-loop ATPase
LDDNYANRTVFVLASPKQSNGKSTFIRWLNPFGIHQYYAENPLEDNKDSRIRISETFIYNLEELATISKFEINRLKAIISQVGTRDRKPYSRQAENIVRRCSFFGSTNLNNFLTDDINTRWLVFDVKSINWGYTEVNKSFVWAQAYKLYKEGFNCELTEEEATYRDAKNLKYQVSMVESDLIQRYFKPAKPHESLAIFLTSTSIHERLLIYTKESKILINNVSVGRALSKLGYERSRHSNIYGYWVIPLTSVGFPTISNDGNIEESYEPPF